MGKYIGIFFAVMSALLCLKSFFTTNSILKELFNASLFAFNLTLIIIWIIFLLKEKDDE